MSPAWLPRTWLAVALALSLLAGCQRPWPIDEKPEPGPVVVPVPKPDVQPVPASGLRVLILEETGLRPSIPEKQLQVLTSTVVRQWLRDHRADWRIWDKDADVSFESPGWQQAMKDCPKDKLPWIAIANDSKSHSGPLPANVDDAMALLKEFAP